MPAARRLRFGIVGCGEVVREFHLPAWKVLAQEVEFTCYYDSSPEALEWTAQHWPQARACGSLEEFLLNAQSLDFAVLATPHSTHYELALRLLACGLHLLVEKPLTLELGHARELYALAAAHDVLLTPLHNYRFYDTVRRGLDKDTRARLGDIMSLTVRLHAGPLRNLDSPWRWRERQQRTLLFDWAYHLVDIALLFLGPVQDLRFVDADTDSTGLQQVVFGTLHRNGARGLFDLAVDAACESHEIRVLGEGAALALEFAPLGMRMLPAREDPLSRATADLRRTLRYMRLLVRERYGARLNRNGDGHLRVFKAFVNAVRGSEANPIPPEQVQELIALLESVGNQAYSQRVPWARAAAASVR